MAKMFGLPGTVRSGSTLIRPARSASTSSHLAAGEASTPAAQMMVLARSTCPAKLTLSTVTSVTGWPSITSTPSFSSADLA